MQLRAHTAAAAAATVFLLSLMVTMSRAAETIKWQTSYSAAKATAKKSHKLILVDFYAEW